MRYSFFFLLLFACSNPSRETGSQPADSAAIVQPADKTAVDQDSVVSPGSDTLHDNTTIRADSL